MPSEKPRRFTFLLLDRFTMLPFTAAIEPRIKVAVANGPVSDFRHHGSHWAVPKGGGVGVVAAFLVGVAALYRYAEFSRLADPYFRGLILASFAIAVGRASWL